LTSHAAEASYLVIFIASSNKFRKEKMVETFSMDGTIKNVRRSLVERPGNKGYTAEQTIHKKAVVMFISEEFTLWGKLKPRRLVQIGGGPL
jgi:hypothetical protein